jgi:Uma2 family endonuclease
MAVQEQVDPREEKFTPSGTIIAEQVSLDDYMAQYAQHHCEWVEGMVIQMSPVHIRHDRIMAYLRLLFDTYFELNPIGTIVSQPFVLHLPEFPNRRREPDLMVVLESNPHELKDTYMDGPADICIEVVSQESTARDHGEKFQEYEKGGVPEYWIIDPVRRECRFYRLSEEGRYARQTEDADALYHTPALPGLALHVPTLWQDRLPGPAATVTAVQTMLKDA